MRQLPERSATRRWVGLLGIFAAACSLDHRVLHHDGVAATPGSGGSGSGTAGTRNTANGANAGMESVTPAAGSAGMREPGSNGGGGTSALPPLVDGCADLDSDGVADCTVTRTQNSAFERDVLGWTPIGVATLTWDADNALADTPSGCARLRGPDASNDSAMIYRASQCVAIPADQIIIVYANARVETTANADEVAHAELEVSYFDTPDCTGKSTGYFATPPSEASSKWVTIQAGGVSATTTTAVSLALVGIRPSTANGLNVCFDNVMVKAKPRP